MNAIELLVQEHDEAKIGMKEVFRSSGVKKDQLFRELKREIEMHNYLEETIFYPSVLGYPGASSLAAKDKVAHKALEEALVKLTLLPMDDPAWSRNFSAMQARLLMHIADEEGTLFVKIRNLLSIAELETLGQTMKIEKVRARKA
jgi:iron-sulfur cluster repair protein YtfE (RIC family)